MRSPPTVRGYPLVGVLPPLVRDPVGFCAHATRTHGDLVKLDLGLSAVYVVSHPEHVRHVLQDRNQNYGKGKAWEAMRHVVGHSLVTADGAYWLRQRRIVQPAFHRDRLVRICNHMVEGIAQRLDSWDASAASGAPIDVHREMKHLTLDTFLRTMFGTSLDADESRALDAALPALVEGIGVAMWASFLPSALPIPGMRRFRAAMKVIDRIVYRVLSERRAADAPRDDVLGMLLAARDEETNERMTDAQLRDEVVGLFIAAFEATSLALSWTCYALTQHAAIAERLAAEVTRVLGRRAPGFEDLKELTYARMVFEESMRFYPPGWVLPRQALEADTIGGYAIPAKAFVLVCNYLTHRHPDFWERPDRFDPERFAPERSADRPRYAFLPFGGGPHQCVGYQFALMEAEFILSMMVQRYGIALAAPVRPKAAHVMIRPHPALLVRLDRRSVSTATSERVTAAPAP